MNTLHPVLILRLGASAPDPPNSFASFYHMLSNAAVGFRFAQAGQADGDSGFSMAVYQAGCECALIGG